MWLEICLKNTEKSAESKEQRAESKEPGAVGGARREIKPTLQVMVGTDLYMALKIGTETPNSEERWTARWCRWCIGACQKVTNSGTGL